MRIAILGLGPSLSLYNPKDFDYAIGVNDIWKHHKTNAIVCVDIRSAFTPERLKWIDNSQPEAFYSQIINYDTRKDFVQIQLMPNYPDHYCNLDTPYINKSLCSPFVACGAAYKYYSPSSISLFGVDMINHKHLDKSMCEKIKIHFGHLKEALAEKNIKFIVHGEGILTTLC
jgi:hypothetical protein